MNSKPENPLDAVNSSEVQLTSGKGSSGRGGGANENYWHIYVNETRVGYVCINVMEEEPFGKYASIQIHINKKHRARGIGSVAYSLACIESGKQQIYAKMRKSNIGSRRAAEKAGFVLVKDLDFSQLAMRWTKTQ